MSKGIANVGYWAKVKTQKRAKWREEREGRMKGERWGARGRGRCKKMEDDG